MRKNANPITTIFFIIFIILFSLFNYEEYSEFHQTKSEIENKNIELNANLEKFELEDIREINDLEFYYTPNKELLTRIVELINNAENEIFLEVYMLTEKRIQESLIKAHNRWIELKIILEKDPYMAYSINDKAYNKLEKAWIDIIWSSKNNYSFNHSKILIIDDLSIISTGNFSYSTFTKNRDFFIFTEDLNTKNKLKENFYNDYNSTKINIFDNNLIFSPNSSRIKFEKLFDEAERDIKMYFQYLKDDELVNKLINIKKEKNISIEIIIPDTATEDENTIKLKNAWINILVLPKYKMHAKAILVDEKYLFIWSINFSTYSIDRNREVWILIKNKNIIDDFLDIYSQDSK